MLSSQQNGRFLPSDPADFLSKLEASLKRTKNNNKLIRSTCRTGLRISLGGTSFFVLAFTVPHDEGSLGVGLVRRLGVEGVRVYAALRLPGQGRGQKGSEEGKVVIPGVAMVKIRVKPAIMEGKREVFGKVVMAVAKDVETVVEAFPVTVSMCCCFVNESHFPCCMLPVKDLHRASPIPPIFSINISKTIQSFFPLTLQTIPPPDPSKNPPSCMLPKILSPRPLTKFLLP